MSNCPCQAADAQVDSRVSTSPQRLGPTALGWALSTLTWLLWPKCPMCVAAYATLLTGVGVTATTATQLGLAVALVAAATSLLLLRAIWKRGVISR